MSANKESVSGHRCERTSKIAKCEMFMNYGKNFIGICKQNYDWQSRDP